MTADQVQALAEAMASMLISHAAHGIATHSLEGTGEITLRDGLIVAAAAEGARTRQAWIIEREVVPAGWTDAPVDLYLRRTGNLGVISTIGGVELKWWRRADTANAANRRRDLVRDFIRAGSLYPAVEDFAFVALLSTAGSWTATTDTDKSDRDAMTKLSADGSQQWNLRNMIRSKAIVNAMASLHKKVPMPNIFHTKLLCTRALTNGREVLAFAKVWAVKKPQNSITLTDADVEALLPVRPAPVAAAVQAAIPAVPAGAA